MINPKFLDVDFRKFPGKLTGCLPRTEPLGSIKGIPVFEEAIPIIPRDEWPERVAEHQALSHYIQEIKDQNGEGSCSSNATSQGFEGMFIAQLGAANWIKTSPISLYKRCASSAGSGSSLSKNLQEIRDRGILPSNATGNKERAKALGFDFPDSHFHPDIGYGRRLPSDWEETAKFFRADEVYDVDSFGGMITALLDGYLVIYARNGHCILAAIPVFDNGRFYIKYANSWGDWGDDGYGTDSESVAASEIRVHGTFAVRTTRIPKILLAKTA